MNATVLGAGSWGTALALLLARNGHEVKLWGRDTEQMALMAKERINAKYVPTCPFPSNLNVTDALGSAVADASLVVVAVPSGGFAETVKAIGGRVSGDVVSATKGFEPGTARFLDTVAKEALGDDVIRAVLSGPTFAGEVARCMPAAVTLAAPQLADADRLAGLFHNGWFRVYANDDMVGVQIGGAVKNVLAIAAGIADGLGFGANARAALITRGLAELTRLGSALGGRPETFMGLAGLGDLVLTCTDNQSRNRRFGLALAEGLAVGDAEKRVGQVVEGRATSREVKRLADELGVDMPIVEQVERVLYQNLSAEQAVRTLLSREARREGG